MKLFPYQDADYQKRLEHWTLDQIRHESLSARPFTASLTKKLGTSTGAVDVAKGRAMKRLIEKARSVDEPNRDQAGETDSHNMAESTLQPERPPTARDLPTWMERIPKTTAHDLRIQH